MKIDIYRSATSSTKYLSVPSGTNVEDLLFPPSIDRDLLKLSPFKTELDVSPEQPRIALDVADVISQIDKNGYAVHSATVTIEITTGNRP